MNSIIVWIVDYCARSRWLVVIVGTLVLLGGAAFDVTNFSINADVDALISASLPWHRRQLELTRAFPETEISVVVSAQTAENAELGTNKLAAALAMDPKLFPLVVQPDNGEFFERNGLMFGSLTDIEKRMHGLTTAGPLLSLLASDPSLRGVAKSVSLAAEGVETGQSTLDELNWTLSLADRTLSDVLSKKPASFSWRQLLQGRPPPANQLRHFIEVEPALNFNELQPGRAATQGIRQAAADLDLTGKFGAGIEMTGMVPMNDDQFAVIRYSALRDTTTAAVGVLFILWLAVRSWKIVVAVFFSLLVGLAATAAAGIAMVGAFNLISIAFFVLFVGLGVDFGIQFSVRYRTERHKHDDLREALRSAARQTGTPLTLAAAATIVGFFAFLPTNYRGLSELGLIAGCGMLIAFLCSITLVPAMLAVLNPPGEPTAVGFKILAPVDAFLQRHRITVVTGTILVALAGAPLLMHLPFDFNPINLQNPTSGAVATYRKLQNDPEANGNDAEVLLPSLEKADAAAKRLAALPEVSRVLTLSSFIPLDQDRKIAALKAASQRLGSSLNPTELLPAPSDQDNVAAIQRAADELSKAAGNSSTASAEAARHVSALLQKLATAAPAIREKAAAAFVLPLNYDLDSLRESLAPVAVTTNSLPPSLVRNWVLADGRARVQALPKGDPNDTTVLKRFAGAVLQQEPMATGAAISDYESGKTVTAAFIDAGVFALAAITILLFIALRRLTDVLLTLVPLLLAGVVSLEICVLCGIALNFANIIALPLLLGVGVAFKIYYIIAWRAGKTGLLQSTLTRAVVFSALTNAVAFGSMWASDYPGLSGMGKMMALVLVCTLASAVLFQPVLMGRPRETISDAEAAAHLDEAAE